MGLLRNAGDARGAYREWRFFDLLDAGGNVGVLRGYDGEFVGRHFEECFLQTVGGMHAVRVCPRRPTT